ncbi:MAG: DUF5688 family protein [Lachnospiraceae bacterium]|nr:DUF5688 family protein [Lachnospiraceae bacterium]
MTYPDFKNSILSGMADRYAGQASVSLTSVKKNNGVELDGLVIHEQDVDLSPTIYLDGYYDMLLDGHSFGEVFDSIIENYEDHKNTSFGAGDCFSDFGWVRAHLVMRLISRRKNEDLLKEVPHIPFLDLALVFAVRMEVKTGLFGSALIHHRHAQFWNTDATELFEHAKKAAPLLLPPAIQKMDDLIGEVVHKYPYISAGTDLPMYVVTNTERNYGASAICYHHVIRELSDEMRSDLYIIPSSVHEVIVIPSDLGIEVSQLNDTIRLVNEDHVSPSEVLSDHTYIYHRNTDKITL